MQHTDQREETAGGVAVDIDIKSPHTIVMTDLACAAVKIGYKDQ